MQCFKTFAQIYFEFAEATFGDICEFNTIIVLIYWASSSNYDI